ncbi:MAG: S9 family peptidase, partial [Pseudomonadota bacterium]
MSQSCRSILTCAAALAALITSPVQSPAFATTQEDNSPVLDSASPTPPIAEKREHTYTHHGITISDPYDWLYDKSYPTIDDEDVLDYVKAENAYFEAKMAPQEELTESLFQEMRARIKEDDATVPQRSGNYMYWSEFEEGAQYRKHYRTPVDAPEGAEPQLILDQNELAEGLEYFRLGALTVSKSGRYLAYSTDTNGSERYTARIKDLETGELLSDELTELRGGLTWVANDTALVYTPSTEEWRSLEIKLHTIGQPNDTDVTLYLEEDQSFSVGAGLSAQEDWLIIASGDNETSEIRLVPANDPTAEPILVRPRMTVGWVQSHINTVLNAFHA